MKTQNKIVNMLIINISNGVEQSRYTHDLAQPPGTSTFVQTFVANKAILEMNNTELNTITKIKMDVFKRIGHYFLTLSYFDDSNVFKSENNFYFKMI